MTFILNRQYDVNVSAIINVTQVVAKKLIEEGREGSIVNISSAVSSSSQPVS